jgi:hypothetical protein
MVGEFSDIGSGAASARQAIDSKPGQRGTGSYDQVSLIGSAHHVSPFGVRCWNGGTGLEETPAAIL